MGFPPSTLPMRRYVSVWPSALRNTCAKAEAEHSWIRSGNTRADRAWMSDIVEPLKNPLAAEVNAQISDGCQAPMRDSLHERAPEVDRRPRLRPGGVGVQLGGDEEGALLRGPLRVFRGALRPGLDLPLRGAGDARSPDPDSAAGRRLLGGSFADRRQFRLPHVGPDDRARGSQRAALLHNAVLGGAAGVASPRR